LSADIPDINENDVDDDDDDDDDDERAIQTTVMLAGNTGICG